MLNLDAPSEKNVYNIHEAVLHCLSDYTLKCNEYSDEKINHNYNILRVSGFLLLW